MGGRGSEIEGEGTVNAVTIAYKCKMPHIRQKPSNQHDWEGILSNHEVQAHTHQEYAQCAWQIEAYAVFEGQDDLYKCRATIARVNPVVAQARP